VSTVFVEEWKDFGHHYKISSLGRIWSKPGLDTLGRKRPGGWLKTHYDMCGYEMTSLVDENNVRRKYYFTQLMAKLFVPNPDNLPQVKHLDGDIANNIASNLQWCESLKNFKYNVAKGTAKNDVGHRKLTKAGVLAMREKFTNGETPRNLAEEYDLHIKSVYKVLNRQIWKHV
jgi:hypothetical protein